MTEIIEDEFEKSKTPIKDNVCTLCDKKYDTKRQLEIHYIANHKKKITENDNYINSIEKSKNIPILKKNVELESPKQYNVLKLLRKTFSDNNENEDDSPDIIENDIPIPKKTSKISKIKQIFTPGPGYNTPKNNEKTCQSNLKYRYYLNVPNNYYHNTYYQTPDNNKNNSIGGYSV